MTNTENSTALKAGFWYVICNIITNGMYFITTPIFTRILSKEDYGITATYNSWFAILTIITTLDLYSCIQLSKVEYEKEAKEFLSSILFLSSISITVFYILCRFLLLFYPSLFGMPVILTDILFAEILFRNAYTLQQTQHRAFLRYKEFVFTTILTSVTGQFLAAFLVMNAHHDQYLGRILGTAVPFFIVGTVIMLLVFYQGKTFFHKEYWLFGLKISVPLIPHHLSGNILTQFDKLIITSYAGLSFTALYSIANNYALALQIIWGSLNNAWIPWFYDKMQKNDITTIRKMVKPYTMLFSLLVVCVITAGPEAILLLGGSDYTDSIHIIPPIALAVYFQFLYSLYSNIEFYYKKTGKLALWTILAAIANVTLNYIFVPRFGYIAAAYTTLAGYLLLFVLHYLSAKKLEKRVLYSKKFLLCSTSCTLLLAAIMYALYPVLFLRYEILIALLAISFIYLRSVSSKKEDM